MRQPAPYRSLWFSLTLVSSLTWTGTTRCEADPYGIAQVIPDSTLGSENSRVRQETIKGIPSDVIEGGATRGANLFHSLQELSIKEGRGAYFTNPSAIQNILTRITGGNPSKIFGTLGVLGNANLFLINPNGIVFGPNARLDVRGAFIGSTADSMMFDNGFEFSTTNPQAPPLLTVNMPLGLRFRQQPSDISNEGNLATPGNLTLKAGNLNLSGSLVAGGDLTLEALNTVTVRDTIFSPFMAVSGGKLTLQGNQSVDIYALNHPQSGLFSGGDMVLRSANTVSADAHFWSGGSFRIERLDGSLGGLVSLYDPVIRANGDVFLESYTGASLHILAGGSVTIPGFVWIQGTDPVNGIVENVTLSDGTIVSIDGRSEPTLDIRAGTTAFGEPFFNTGTPTSADINIGTIFFAVPDQSGNPTTPLAGKILLTNQYQPNSTLNGNIQLSATQGGFLTGIATLTSDFNSGGSVTIDSRGEIIVNGTIQASALSTVLPPAFPNYLGNGGDVTLLANGDIIFNPGFIFADGLLGGNITLNSQDTISISNSFIRSRSSTLVSDLKGDDINLTARSLSLNNGTIVGTTTAGRANAGNIVVNVTDIVTLNNVSSLFSGVEPGAVGNTGTITLNADSLFLTNGGQVTTLVSRASQLDGRIISAGQGNTGNITVRARDITIDGVFVNPVNPTKSLVQSIVDRGATGTAGNIDIQATNSLTLSNRAGIGSILNNNATGRSGDINIKAGSLSISDGSAISNSTFGIGNAGNIKIEVRDAFTADGANGLVTSGIQSNVESGGVGNGGNMDIESGSLSLTNAAQLQTSIRGETIIPQNNGLPPIILPPGQGQAGNIRLIIRDTLTLDGFKPVTVNGVEQILGSSIFSTLGLGLGKEPIGRGGDINIKAGSLSLTNNTRIASSTFGTGNAGNIKVEVSNAAILDNSAIQSNVESGGVGNAGTIEVTADLLSLTGISQIDTFVRSASLTPNGIRRAGQGNGGNVSIKAREIIFDGIISDQFGNSLSSGIVSQVSPGAMGIAGNVNIEATESFSLRNGAIVTSQLGFNAIGSSGDINITTGSLSLFSGSNIAASTRGEGNSGNIRIEVSGTATIDGAIVSTQFFNSKIISSVESGGVGNAGTIELSAGSLFLTNGGQISTFVRRASEIPEGIMASAGRGNGGNINIRANNVVLDGFAVNQFGIPFVSAIGSNIDEGATGDAGNIDIQVANSFSLNNGASIVTALNTNAVGRGGDINITAQSLSVINNAQINASTSGQGNAGNILVKDAETISLDNSLISTQIESTAQPNSNISPFPSNITLNTNNLTLINNSRISASTAGGIEAGNITINSDILNLSQGSRLETLTRSNANAGDITLNSVQKITIAQVDSGLFAQTEGQGTAGSIFINTPIFNIDENAIISARTSNAGDGGDITINAPNSVTLGNNSQLTVETSNAGRAGDITITSDTITIGKDAQLSATARETATNTEGGGSITLNTSNLNISGKLGIFAETQGESLAGSLILQPNNNNLNLNIRFTDNGFISASTTAAGDGGDITINVPQAIDIRGQGKIAVETSGSGNAGNIAITTRNLTLGNGLEISASTTKEGDAGKITITGDSLTLTGGANIQTSTTSSGKAGNIVFNLNNNFNLTNSSIEASTDRNSTGDGGNITIDPITVTLTNNARISVNSQGQGDGGNIFLTTQNLTLNNRSEISATTASGEGGNVTLKVADTMRQRNNSSVSTTAGGTGNGGDITLDTKFLINTDNSNITANALQGTGGNVKLTATGIFLDTTSLITASSQFGIDGVVETNTLVNDPSQGLVTFPVQIIDPNALIAQNACRKGGQSEFIISGRGGLPSSPEQVQSSDEVAVSLVRMAEHSTNKVNSSANTDNNQEIVPAQGWIRNGKGQVLLVGENPNNTPNQRQINDKATCSAL